MTAVFRFTKRKHAKAAVEHGQLRLSHVAGFRVSDGIDAGRSDPSELTSTAQILDQEETVLSNDPRFGGIFTFIRNGINVPTKMVVSGDSFQALSSGLLFCTSLDNSNYTFDRMQTMFGADAAYEIADVDEFAQRIQLHLVNTEPHLLEIQAEIQRLLDSPHPVPGFNEAMHRCLQSDLERQRPFTVASGPVTYFDEPRAQSVAAMPLVDPFRKPRIYEWQREHRIVIHPYNFQRDLDIELPGLRDLLRIVR